MTVIVNIWLGELPQFTVWNAIYGLNVGHGSMLVINDENPEDTVYISHRPQTTDSENSKAKFHNKDTSKQYALGDSFTPKAEWISFNEDCERRGRKPGNQIYILGLNESRIRKVYQKYLNNYLPKPASQYHLIKNNCCAVVVLFIRIGLSCLSYTFCDFCSAETNQPNSKHSSNIFDIKPFSQRIMVNLINLSNDNKFWSPLSLEHFVTKVKEITNKKCQTKL
ncbi:MAG: hypothetical protein F6K40_07405 [Okeania sp. SIO3I5]|uniref:hypothetical protein n=1 Tax=Okeania sp. SIO3I5 TaxID=2607805 RepID=UPI0013B5DBB3|nr:hypothetical protein [Okeania sp. SIO3I5]NEQ36119.1 hypothetical protein [Okeania sp. SIO3I5]